MKFFAKKTVGVANRSLCLVACTVLAACSTNPHTERAQLAAPTAVAEMHTQAQLSLALAIKLDAKSPCPDSNCGETVGLEQRVQMLGQRLSEAAFQRYPDLAQRIPAFEFTVVDKAEPGTVSTPGGAVGVLRPVGGIAQNDEALSFVLAREMGHVVGQHHEENTATSAVVSILATLLAPVVKVVKVIATVYQSVTPITASASVTAASFASSRLLISSYRPVQREEADVIAMNLLRAASVDERAAYEGFSRPVLEGMESVWTKELKESLGRLNVRVAARTEELARDSANRQGVLSLKLATEIETPARSSGYY